MGETQKSFVNERRGVERPELAFAPEVSGGEFFQLIVDQRDDCPEGLPIAGMDTLQQFGDLHGRFESLQHGGGRGGIERRPADGAAVLCSTERRAGGLVPGRDPKRLSTPTILNQRCTVRSPAGSTRPAGLPLEMTLAKPIRGAA